MSESTILLENAIRAIVFVETPLVEFMKGHDYGSVFYSSLRVMITS
jgi:hypothetical protein